MTTLAEARTAFDAGRGFLAAASIGIPTRETIAAQKADLDAWAAASKDPQDYDAVVARTRDHFARLVGMDASRVAIGSQTSVLTSLVAAAVPQGVDVLCVDGDFSSIIFPFLQRSGVTVRSVPLGALAESIGPETWMVVFSHIQSATGAVADVAAILEAATRHDAVTFCDTTQSAGVHPVDAGLFDITVCHAYKWLCAPRGVAFLTVSERVQPLLTPIQAGWDAGQNVWTSVYGPQMQLAADARRFDVSPAWPAWVGAGRPPARRLPPLE